MLSVGMHVTSEVGWPNKEVVIPFEGRRIHLVTLNASPDLLFLASLKDDNDTTTYTEGCTLLSRFISRMAWSFDASILEWTVFSNRDAIGLPYRSLRQPGGLPPHRGFGPVEPWETLYLPSAGDPRADKALALYREGMGINSAPLAVLSYFKVLNIVLEGSQQAAWINANLSKVESSAKADPSDGRLATAIRRLDELRKTKPNIGKYLYEQGRCAVAHARLANSIHPDHFEDRDRLALDLPLMREIAALYIEEELGVLSRQAFLAKPKASGATTAAELLHRTKKVAGSDVYV